MDKTNFDSKPRFSSTAKLMHWGFVLLFIYALLKQIDDLNQLEDAALLRFEVIFAGVFVLLLLIRFVYMKTTQKSSLPDYSPKSQILAAKVVHSGMYICLALIPLTGLLIGLQLKVNQAKFIKKLMDNKLLTIRAAENVVRVLPPLNVKKSEINQALKIIKKVCSEMN